MGAGYGGGSMSSSLAANALGNLMGNLGSKAGLPDNNSEQSQTLSVISPATVTITGGRNSNNNSNSDGNNDSEANVATLTSRDPATANATLTNTLTLQQAQQLENERQTQQENALAAQLVGSIMADQIGNVAAQAGWAEGSTQKLLLHGLAGLIEAKIAGSNALAGLAAGAANEAMIPVMEKYLRSQGITNSADFNALMKLGSALVGAAVGALAGGDTQSAATGASVSLTGTVNNYLKHNEIAKYWKAKAACENGDKSACGERDKLQAISDQRDAKLAACQGNTGTTCEGLRQEVRYAQAEIIRKGGSGFIGNQLSLGTQTQADKTFSAIDRTEGILQGAVNSVVDGIVSLANGLKTVLVAAYAKEGSPAQQQAMQSIVDTGTSLAALVDPDIMAQVINGATAAQREQIAAAYESGDAYALGRVSGEVLTYLVGIGSIKNTGKVADAVQVAEKTQEAIKIAEAANVAEAAKYTNRLDVTYRSAADVNSKEFAADYSPPYQVGTRVTEYTTKEADQFVRVSLGEQAAGQWMMRKEAIQGLTPEQIAQKYSLPAVPKYISDVNVPAGTQIRTGSAATNFGGNQGAVQYQLISPIPNNSFTNTRPLR